MSSFTSDLQVYAELDTIAGTTGTASYDREVFVEFFRSKGWIIAKLAQVLKLF